jgi:rubrerythrin
MDLSDFSLEDLLLAAIKSEMDAEQVYLGLAKEVKNPFLKGRLEFLANEEKKHKLFLQNIYKQTFPGKTIAPPKESVVPMPEVRLYGETGAMRDIIVVLEDAMKAEKAAHEFYASLMDRFSDEKIRKILKYLSIMEQDHYEILKKERDELGDVETVMEDYDYMQLDGM